MVFNPENPDWKEGANWGIKEGQKHKESSPETKIAFKAMSEEINKINTNMTKLEGKFDLIGQKLDLHIEQQNKDEKARKEDFVELKELIKDVVENKADVWVETAIKTIIGFIILGILSVAGSLIYRAIIHFN